MYDHSYGGTFRRERRPTGNPRAERPLLLLLCIDKQKRQCEAPLVATDASTVKIRNQHSGKEAVHWEYEADLPERLCLDGNRCLGRRSETVLEEDLEDFFHVSTGRRRRQQTPVGSSNTSWSWDSFPILSGLRRNLPKDWPYLGGGITQEMAIIEDGVLATN